MADPIALTKDINRAAQAEALLRNELLNGAFATLDAEYLDAWRGSSARDSDARERLWQAVQIVGKVRSHLQSVANNGKLAQRELDEIEKLGERKKAFGFL